MTTVAPGDETPSEGLWLLSLALWNTVLDTAMLPVTSAALWLPHEALIQPLGRQLPARTDSFLLLLLCSGNLSQGPAPLRARVCHRENGIRAADQMEAGLCNLHVAKKRATHSSQWWEA